MPDPWSWTISYPKGATCRAIMWGDKEVAIVNARGDFTEDTEADLAAGLAHSGRMHMLLRRIQDEIRNDGDLSKATVDEIHNVIASVATMDAGVYEERDDD
jgi:hypothetical protein